MKPSTTPHALRRIKGIVARETGKPLTHLGAMEVEGLLEQWDRRWSPAALGNEFLSREVTILLADLRGFTSLAAGQPAGIVMQLLNPCFNKMSEIIFKHQGTIDKFMGDSIMVLFGAPVSRADDVRRAVACAVEMQMAMTSVNVDHMRSGMPELYMCVGINTGNVLAGMLGSKHYCEYTVIGHEVNLASRIEAFSLRGQILISQSTFERCRGFIETGSPMVVHVKGKSDPVSLREVLAIPSLDLRVPRRETRRSHRCEVNLACTYHLAGDGNACSEERHGTIHDIGYHGVLIELGCALPPGAEIKLDFDLPLIDYHAAGVCAKAVSPKPENGRILIGFEFMSLSAETNMKVQLFVQLLIFTTRH